MAYHKYSITFKIIFSVLCTILFLIFMKDVWNKYSSEITRTGIRVRNSREGKKLLPCLTICPVQGFKVKGFFHGETAMLENSFSWEDVFAEKTIHKVRNNTLYSTTRPCSQFLGCCFTLCNLILYEAKLGPILLFKTNVDLKVFVHNKGIEFWFSGFSDSPNGIPFVIIEANNKKGMTGSLLSILVYEIIALNKREEPCSSDSEENFIDCCKKSIWDNFNNSYGCRIHEMKSTVPKDVKMEECQSIEIASKIQWEYGSFLSSFVVEPWFYGCPIPCPQTNYKLTLDTLHKNTINFPVYGPDDQVYYIFSYFFPSLNVEERIESLEYDFGNFLVAAGGNLGLFLGFSCLSVLFSIVKYSRKLVQFNYC